MSGAAPPNTLEILKPFDRGGFRYVLFDFDGTISLLREGWQGIMAPMMCEAIASTQPITDEIHDAVNAFIDESTGIQTIIQMERLVDMVRSFGLVPEGQILDARGYKKIYNDRLMEPVRARLDQLESGALPIDEVTVRGVRRFLDQAARHAERLYIFSGTDRDDVINEAQTLGVADYFTEIWGALDSIEAFSKEKVLRELIEQNGLSGPEVLIVGDGPVEIRHAHEFGCTGIGVCSNEATGFGWDDEKRARLTKAGAHALIPDFGTDAALGDYLFNP